MPIRLKSEPIPQMELSGINAVQGVTHFVVQPHDDVQLHYEKASGKLFLGDSLKWLANLESGTVDLAFAGMISSLNYEKI